MKATGRPDSVVGTFALNHKIKIMFIAILIFPCHFTPLSCRAFFCLIVKVETLPTTEILQLRSDDRLKQTTYDLPKSMRWRFSHL